MTTEQSAENTQQTLYALCVTCGRLKNTELFEEGECTCADCHQEGRTDVNYREREDGYFEEVES